MWCKNIIQFFISIRNQIKDVSSLYSIQLNFLAQFYINLNSNLSAHISKIEKDQKEGVKKLDKYIYIQNTPKKYDQTQDHLLNKKICGKYLLKRRIGYGAFGLIYHATNLRNNQDVAVKLESVYSRMPQLLYQTKVIKRIQGVEGIPHFHWYGIEFDYNVMVLDYLGPSLYKLFNQCNRKFSLKTVLMIANQILKRIEFLHSRHFIHGDIKPDNFLIGLQNKKHIIYIIDFGLSKLYIDISSQKHIKYTDNNNSAGTPRFQSIYAHLGIQQSRRDDLLSIGYMLVYFMKGCLPWQKLQANDQIDKIDAIKNAKLKTSIQKLCSDLPQDFTSYFEYCDKLEFTDNPDYHYLRKLFNDLFDRMGFQWDYVFDWVEIENRKLQAAITQDSKKIDEGYGYVQGQIQGQVQNQGQVQGQEDTKLPQDKNYQVAKMLRQQGRVNWLENEINGNKGFNQDNSKNRDWEQKPDENQNIKDDEILQEN